MRFKALYLQVYYNIIIPPPKKTQFSNCYKAIDSRLRMSVRTSSGGAGEVSGRRPGFPASESL